MIISNFVYEKLYGGRTTRAASKILHPSFFLLSVIPSFLGTDIPVPDFLPIHSCLYSPKMDRKNVDYSLYLVTDSTPAILGDRNLVDVVDAAVRGGVTIVQYRDKYSDTAALVDTARKLHAVTRKYNVPLLINDRIDVALAVACEGVHIGQDDMG